MNGYVAMYRGKKIELFAATTFEAQLAAAAIFKAKKAYEVSVYLVKREDGSSVTHTPVD